MHDSLMPREQHISITKNTKSDITILFGKPYLMELYKHEQKEDWFHITNGNNHDALAILMDVLLYSQLSADHYFSCIIGFINFIQWDPGG